MEGIIKEIKMVYQPIYDLSTNKVLGYEALARGPCGPFHLPKNLFDEASREGLLDMVEIICFKLAVEKPPPGNIFINFSPSTVISHYQEIIKHLVTARNKVVVELIEYAVPEQTRHELIGILRELRCAGCRVALDDVGNGDRGFSDICEIPADFMKIDRRLVQGLTRNSAPRYQITLNTMVRLAGMLNMQVIAEGVESETQYSGIRSAGITFAQGFFLARPQPTEYWAANGSRLVVGHAGSS